MVAKMPTKRTVQRTVAKSDRKSGKQAVKYSTKYGVDHGDRRSTCPISFALDRLGDRWSLLLIRDLALRGKCSFSELLRADEGVATNVLSDRLMHLERNGLVHKRRNVDDRRRFSYQLTEAGKDLIPVLVEILLWGVAYDANAVAPDKMVESIKRDRKGFIRRARAKLDEDSE